jgi:hypothetical protein
VTAAELDSCRAERTPSINGSGLSGRDAEQKNECSVGLRRNALAAETSPQPAISQASAGYDACAPYCEITMEEVLLIDRFVLGMKGIARGNL